LETKQQKILLQMEFFLKSFGEKETTFKPKTSMFCFYRACLVKPFKKDDVIWNNLLKLLNCGELDMRGNAFERFHLYYELVYRNLFNNQMPKFLLEKVNKLFNEISCLPKNINEQKNFQLTKEILNGHEICCFPEGNTNPGFDLLYFERMKTTNQRICFAFELRASFIETKKNTFGIPEMKEKILKTYNSLKLQNYHENIVFIFIISRKNTNEINNLSQTPQFLEITNDDILISQDIENPKQQQHGLILITREQMNELYSISFQQYLNKISLLHVPESFTVFPILNYFCNFHMILKYNLQNFCKYSQVDL